MYFKLTNKKSSKVRVHVPGQFKTESGGEVLHSKRKSVINYSDIGTDYDSDSASGKRVQ